MGVDHQPAICPLAEPPGATSARPERYSNRLDAHSDQPGSERPVDLVPDLHLIAQRRQLNRLVARKGLGTADPERPNRYHHRPASYLCGSAIIDFIATIAAHSVQCCRTRAFQGQPALPVTRPQPANLAIERGPVNRTDTGTLPTCCQPILR